MRERRWPGVRAACVAIVAAGVALAPARAAQEGGPDAGSGSILTREARRGDRLEVRSYRGGVTIEAWDRNELRVEAKRTGESILVDRVGSRLRVIPSSWAKDAPGFEVQLPEMARIRVVGEEPATVDLVISAPAWMPLVIEGPFIEVALAGFESSVEVTVAVGGVEVRSTSGPVSVVDMSGAIVVEDATGTLTLGGGGRSITVRRCSGDLRAETSVGDIRLEDLRSGRVEVTTVGGSISWNGPLARDGRYDLSTHRGEVDLKLPGVPDAAFSIRTHKGRIETNLPVPPGADADRLEITSGDGRGSVRIVSFLGTIRLVAE